MPKTVDFVVLYKAALNSGITLLPGYLFSATTFYRNYIRLNAGKWPDEISHAIVRLAELVEKWKDTCFHNSRFFTFLPIVQRRNDA